MTEKIKIFFFLAGPHQECPKRMARADRPRVGAVAAFNFANRNHSDRDSDFCKGIVGKNYGDACGDCRDRMGGIEWGPLSPVCRPPQPRSSTATTNCLAASFSHLALFARSALRR